MTTWRRANGRCVVSTFRRWLADGRRRENRMECSFWHNVIVAIWGMCAGSLATSWFVRRGIKPKKGS